MILIYSWALKNKQLTYDTWSIFTNGVIFKIYKLSTLAYYAKVWGGGRTQILPILGGGGQILPNLRLGGTQISLAKMKKPPATLVMISELLPS